LAKLVNDQAENLYRIIPEIIYGEDEVTMEMVIGKLLKSKNKTVSTAESCTGGEIAHLITSVAGSSSYYQGSVIAYSNTVKTQLLGVRKETIDSYGAVSEQTVTEMAEGARKLFGTDFALATSGIAGPDGGTEEKPVGTLWIAVASEKGVVTEKRSFGNDRIINIRRFSLVSLNLLRKQIINH
jgi:nicotinamide-nucleotide amidase